MHHGISHIVGVPCWTSDLAIYPTGHQTWGPTCTCLSTSDIWWWSLVNCSNYPREQHLVATETGSIYDFQARSVRIRLECFLCHYWFTFRVICLMLKKKKFQNPQRKIIISVVFISPALLLKVGFGVTRKNKLVMGSLILFFKVLMNVLV